MVKPSPLIFLSHSGADAEAARELKRRLLASPDAEAAGLKVWFDKDDLRPEISWSAQIAKAIQTDATAFVVYIGSGGVMNWAEAEVDLALSRATTDKQSSLLFIPALAAESKGSSALPPFAKRYQGVRDPLGDGEALSKLLKAVLHAEWDTSVRLIDEPFVGLRSMREEEADRFFGREGEVKELVEKFRRHRIMAIVADSGTGKSSLAAAGFAPAFRGGALADPSREGPDDRVWHVVVIRPRANPEEGLRLGISEAARKLGQSPDERARLRKRIAIADPSETGFAVQCDLPALNTATLLIVDQFEELLTSTPDALVAPFAKLLLDLADGDKDVRILLTVRADYFNLLSDIKDATGEAIRGVDGKTLFERLNSEGGDAILRLKRVSEDGLCDIVCKPLRLAGVSDDQTALVTAVQNDISDQPSDLPLLQVALKAAWQERKTTGGPMLDAYLSVGGVRRALANEAEKVRARLSSDDQARLESIFVRLVRLGDTGGATRRTAPLDEFDEVRRGLLQRLAGDEYARLVAVGETSAEISHEALITQWPWLQRTLKGDARDVRRLDRLMEKTQEWSKARAERKIAYLATGAERESFDELAQQRPDWLSNVDRGFVEASNESHRAEIEKRDRAFRVARHNESVALTALANIEAARRPVHAAKLALAAWPRDSDDTMSPKLPETLDALGRIVPNLRERRLFKDAGQIAAFSPDGKQVLTASSDNTARLWDAASGAALVTFKGHEGEVASAAFSPDGKQVLTASWDKTARLWDAASGAAALVIFKGHDRPVVSAAFSPDGKQVLTTSSDKTARLWDAASGAVLVTLEGHDGPVYSAAFSPDGKQVLTASDDKTARLWDAASGAALVTFNGHGGSVRSAAFSPDGKQVLTASDDKTARLWDAASGAALVTFNGHDDRVVSAAFSRDGKQLLTASDDNTARLWDAASGAALATFEGHDGAVRSAAFSPDGRQVLTASWDKTARLWDAASGAALVTFKGHEGAVYSAAFSPDGKQALTASYDNTARLWEAVSGTALVTFKGHDERVVSAAFSPDGKQVLTASWDKTARLWDAASGAALVTFKGHERLVYSAAFSPDGKQVLTASSDNTARLWDAASGTALITFKGHDGAVGSAAFSPDEKQVLTASSDNTARLWDAASGAALVTLKGHDRSVVSAAFSPDGKQVLTASSDNTARLWDAASGKAIAVLTGHEDRVHSAAFSPDGERIVTASQDKTARIWDVSAIPKGNILQVACALLRLHEDPVSLEGVTDYPLTFDRQICVTDPPPPDLPAETAARAGP